jgi:hypothetical protein
MKVNLHFYIIFLFLSFYLHLISSAIGLGNINSPFFSNIIENVTPQSSTTKKKEILNTSSDQKSMTFDQNEQLKKSPKEEIKITKKKSEENIEDLEINSPIIISPIDLSSRSLGIEIYGGYGIRTQLLPVPLGQISAKGIEAYTIGLSIIGLNIKGSLIVFGGEFEYLTARRTLKRQSILATFNCHTNIDFLSAIRSLIPLNSSYKLKKSFEVLTINNIKIGFGYEQLIPTDRIRLAKIMCQIYIFLDQTISLFIRATRIYGFGQFSFITGIKDNTNIKTIQTNYLIELQEQAEDQLTKERSSNLLSLLESENDSVSLSEIIKRVEEEGGLDKARQFAENDLEDLEGGFEIRIGLVFSTLT